LIILTQSTQDLNLCACCIVLILICTGTFVRCSYTINKVKQECKITTEKQIELTSQSMQNNNLLQQRTDNFYTLSKTQAKIIDEYKMIPGEL